MFRIAASFAAALALAGSPAGAATLTLAHPYGELVDRGEVTAYYGASYPDRVDCTIPPSVSRSGRVVVVTARRVPPGAQGPVCVVPDLLTLGELSAGWWTVTLRILDAVGDAVVEELVTQWQVGTPDTLCHRFPMQRSALIVSHRMMDGHGLAARIGGDPAFAARLGHPAEIVPMMHSRGAVLRYGWLDNPHDLRAALVASGEFDAVDVDGLLCLSAPPPDEWGDVVEFHHAALGHYFYAVDAQEIASLDRGTGAQGWARTGKSFRVLVRPGCPPARHEQAAYRFFGRPGIGPSSHVFTVDRAECRVVDRTGAWLFEGSPFWATPPDARGGCPAGEVPLYRAWKPFGDSNHRFTTERAVVADMVASGWVDEGIAMCVRH